MVSLEEWLEPVIEEMDPEAAIESQYKKINTDKVCVSPSAPHHLALGIASWLHATLPLVAKL
jgi:hypothetical protein